MSSSTLLKYDTSPFIEQSSYVVVPSIAVDQGRSDFLTLTRPDLDPGTPTTSNTTYGTIMESFRVAVFPLFLCVSLLQAHAILASASYTPPSRPNIILFFADDLGYGDVGFTGHPTTVTPHLDRLASQGKILTTWYSGCHVCTGSRAALLTGRQFLRSGLPGVLGATSRIGLPLNDTTVAEVLREAGYRTAACGKWHVGDRNVYLPANRGFDSYLGIPYSDDMGHGRQSACLSSKQQPGASTAKEIGNYERRDPLDGYADKPDLLVYPGCDDEDGGESNAPHDPAADYLPLVYQADGKTTVLEQPVDFTTLTQRYTDFCVDFLQRKNATKDDQPFFLYIPFSHVHTTANTPDLQYAGCGWQNATRRGPFGDALAELDGMVGAVVAALEEDILDKTLILFTSDNGPWLIRGLSGGSAGLLTGRSAGYWDTGKGTTWEGGIRMPAFAYWKGTIPPHSRSAETLSSLDVLPTLASLAGATLPQHRIFDGKDISDVILGNGPSPHDFLFFYGTCDPEQAQHKGSRWSVAAVRHGPYKAHWCTAPGMSNIGVVRLYRDTPLLFDVEQDPSEAFPLNPNGTIPTNPIHLAALERIRRAHAMEVATFSYGVARPEPDGPGEGPGRYGQCCDRRRACKCDDADASAVGWGNIGSRIHHDAYHTLLGQEEPTPPRTAAQAALQKLEVK